MSLGGTGIICGSGSVLGRGGGMRSVRLPSPAEPEIPSMLNSAKLSLPANTAVGTQVQVTDGFVVGGAGVASVSGLVEVDGFYTKRGTYDSHDFYNRVDKATTDPGLVPTMFCVYHDSGTWRISDSEAATAYVIYPDSDSEFPWLAGEWTTNDGNDPAPVLVHPAVQQLASPSTAQGGVFVSGGTQDGVYELPVEDEWRLLGRTGGEMLYKTGDLRWLIVNNGGTAYYSLSDVATPDLATDWKNASDDSPASITVSSVTSGDLTAGLVRSGTVYTVSGNQNGRNLYHDVLGVAVDIGWDGTKWTDGTHDGSGNTAIPSLAGLGTKDPVADEANWDAP